MKTISFFPFFFFFFYDYLYLFFLNLFFSFSLSLPLSLPPSLPLSPSLSLSLNLQVAYRNDGNEIGLRASAFESIAAIIQYGAKDTEARALEIVPHLMEKLKETFNMNILNNDDREIQIEFQVFFFFFFFFFFKRERKKRKK